VIQQAQAVHEADPGRPIGPTLELREVSKSFNGVCVLDQASLTLKGGEIHGLLGQNGSGKSTLIKILAGYHHPDPGGAILAAGHPLPLPIPPTGTPELAMAFVHQDLGLVEGLTVLDNLRVGRFRHSGLRPISWRQERLEAKQALRHMDVKVGLDWPISRLSETTRALLAIGRAAFDMMSSEGHRLLVLDEPTAYLPREQVDRLFSMLKAVSRDGIAVLFVSHQMGEVLAITDRVTVLRDGKVVATAPTSTLSESQLIELIIGRGLLQEEESFAHAAHSESAALLTAEGVTGQIAQDVSFELARGEMLGITGLAGTGWEELPYLIYGAQPAQSGQVALGGQNAAAGELSAQRSVRSGVVLVPANRLRDAIASSLTVEENVALPVLPAHFSSLRLRLGELRKAVRHVLRAVDVRPPDPTRRISTLSGGNQQRAVLGKWLQTNPSVLLLHEPAQGVDVGARVEIFRLITEAAKNGVAVLLATADNDDLGRLCDRVLIFRDGRIVSELHGNQVNPESVLEETYKSGRAAEKHQS
jgi:ribose transport system ATP-binding protein